MANAIDRYGMLQDVHAIIRRVWNRNHGHLSGEPLEFKNEAESFERDLAISEFCPDLRTFPLDCTFDSHKFRCGNCRQMQHGGSLGIYISDSTMMGDPQWAVLENMRQARSGTAWCVPCVRKLLRTSEPGH